MPSSTSTAHKGVQKCTCAALQHRYREFLTYVEHKKNTYHDVPKDNTAFECCIDVISRLILKYGPNMLEKIEQKEMRDTHCEETDNML